FELVELYLLLEQDLADHRLELASELGALQLGGDFGVDPLHDKRIDARDGFVDDGAAAGRLGATRSGRLVAFLLVDDGADQQGGQVALVQHRHRDLLLLDRRADDLFDQLGDLAARLAAGRGRIEGSADRRLDQQARLLDGGIGARPAGGYRGLGRSRNRLQRRAIAALCVQRVNARLESAFVV